MDRNTTTSKTIRGILAIVFIYSGLFVIDYINNHNHTHTLCLFKNLTGIPCAGCGLSRATLAFFRGNFTTAFHYNILSIPSNICAVISFFWLSTDLVRKKDTFIQRITKQFPLVYIIPFIILTAISWIVNIIRGI